MKIRDLTELATQNLREALLRNSLTTLGIAVGVASLVAMLSLGVGLQQLINRRLERNGLFDTVLVRPRTSFNRSEEHTSELQSQSNLVCRLLLEKKKQPVSGVHATPGG